MASTTPSTATHPSYVADTGTMNPMPELTPILKQLRLSGIVESLDRRTRQAIENKMTYPEFLALIVQDEAARRDQKKYASRIRRAGFRGDKTIESFDRQAPCLISIRTLIAH